MKNIFKTITSATLIFIMALTFTSCGGSKPTDAPPSAQDVTTEFVKAVTMADIDLAVSYAKDTTSFDFYYQNSVTDLHSLINYLVSMYEMNTLMSEDIYNQYIDIIEEVCRETLERYTVEVTEATETETQATVTCVISTPDINPLLDSAINTIADIEDLTTLANDDWIRVLSDMEIELKTSAASIESTPYEETFTLEKIEGEWKVIY